MRTEGRCFPGVGSWGVRRMHKNLKGSWLALINPFPLNPGIDSLLGGRIKDQLKPKAIPVLDEVSAMTKGKHGSKSDQEHPILDSWLPLVTLVDLDFLKSA